MTKAQNVIDEVIDQRAMGVDDPKRLMIRPHNLKLKGPEDDDDEDDDDDDEEDDEGRSRIKPVRLFNFGQKAV